MLTLLTVLFGMLVVGAIVGLILHDALLARLRARHPGLWQALGSPDRVFDDGGLAGLSAVRRLYRQPELAHRCCPEIVAMISRARTYGRAYLLFAIATAAAAAACLGRLL
jgi:hypothetical protein